jgi:hypothetical protein
MLAGVLRLHAGDASGASGLTMPDHAEAREGNEPQAPGARCPQDVGDRFSHGLPGNVPPSQQGSRVSGPSTQETEADMQLAQEHVENMTRSVA